jgi:hypothetical protein
MYTIPIIKRYKFLSSARMPIQKAISDRFYNNGSIDSVDIYSNGSNYSVNTYATITGDGLGAEADPNMSDGNILGATIAVMGSGYTWAEITFIDPAGEGNGAIGAVILSDGDLISDQATVEQTTKYGEIYKIVITNPGSNYNTATVEIVGDGTSICTASTTIVDGLITDIVIAENAQGAGYTFANVIITGDNLDNDPTSESATAYAIISGNGGHGFNAPEELFANTLCLYSNIRNSSTLPLSQDFREYGIIKNPRTLSGSLITSDIAMCAHILTFNTIAGLVEDEILYSSDVRVKVVNIIDFNVVVTALNNNTITVPIILTAETNISRTYTINTIVSSPSTDKFSGNILFVSDSDKYTFSSEQEISIKTFIKL